MNQPLFNPLPRRLIRTVHLNPNWTSSLIQYPLMALKTTPLDVTPMKIETSNTSSQ